MSNYAENQIHNAMTAGLDPDKERAFQGHMDFMKKKYEANINSLGKAYPGMETFICFLVLCSNARAYAAGKTKEIWPGAGTVNMPELIKDVKKLDSFTQIIK